MNKIPMVKAEDWMELGQDVKVIDITSKKIKRYLDKTRKGKKWDWLRQGFDRKKLKYTPKIIKLFGSSGSGKDRIVNLIIKTLKNEVMPIEVDWYYGPWGKSDNGKKFVANNYDHPQGIDSDLLKQQLELLQKGFCVRAPVYEFKTHGRLNLILKQSPILKPKRLILVYGVMAAEVLKDVLSALSIFVYAPFSTCMERRIKRDIEERNRTREQCLEQIKSTVLPGFKKFVLPYSKKALVVDNSLNVSNIKIANKELKSEKIIKKIRELL